MATAQASIRGIRCPDGVFAGKVAACIRRRAETAKQVFAAGSGSHAGINDLNHQVATLESAAQYVESLPQTDLSLLALWTIHSQGFNKWTDHVFEPPNGSEMSRILSMWGIYTPADPRGLGQGPAALVGELIAAGIEDSVATKQDLVRGAQLAQQEAEAGAAAARQRAEQSADHSRELETAQAELVAAQAEIERLGKLLEFTRGLVPATDAPARDLRPRVLAQYRQADGPLKFAELAKAVEVGEKDKRLRALLAELELEGHLEQVSNRPLTHKLAATNGAPAPPPPEPAKVTVPAEPAAAGVCAGSLQLASEIEDRWPDLAEQLRAGMYEVDQNALRHQLVIHLGFGHTLNQDENKLSPADQAYLSDPIYVKFMSKAYAPPQED